MITAALMRSQLNPLKSQHVKRHAKESRNNSRKISAIFSLKKPNQPKQKNRPTRNRIKP
jgi:hypothetical protein